MNSSKGYIFLTVLVFLQIFALLSLWGLMDVSSVIKKIDHQWQRDKLSLSANETLHRLATNLDLIASQCIIPIIPSVELADKPILWWKQHACSDMFSGIQYYYAVEWLGKDICGVIQIASHENRVAMYYRITLVALPTNFKDAKIILQSTVTRATDEVSSCQGKLHRIVLGSQMKREI